MPSTDSQIIKLNFLPGFHRESTKYSEEGKWYDGNRVRFREGKPENLRGYNKYSNTALLGFPRHLITWTNNDTQPLQGIGTNIALYVVKNGSVYDSTPITSTVSVSGNFETFTTQAVVKVSLNNHGVSANDRVLFQGVDASIGGNINLNGTYTIISTSGANHFYVSVSGNAESDASNQGTTGTINLLLNTEESDNIQGLGYGAGVYNAGTETPGERAWNEPASASNIIFQGAMWTLDNWGEDLLAQRRGGQLYYLDISLSSTPERATLVTASPIASTFIVSPNDRHVICYGAEGFATSVNPMLVRWSDQEDFTTWQPADTNTAGEVQLADGSRIIGATRSKNSINIWTDNALYTQTYVGGAFVFQFRQVGTNCGLIGPHAVIDYDGISFWMGDNNFFLYDGVVRTLPCTIRRKIYEDFNTTNKEKVYAGINSEFKEIVWLYPLAASTEPNAYVIYNIEERTWVYGKLFEDGIVTTFQDRVVFNNTITTGRTSATGDMYIWNNEPEDVYTGDGQSLSSYLESASFDLNEGKEMMFMNRIIPDYSFDAGEQIKFKLKFKEYPNSVEKEKGPFTINANTTKIDLRARGRQASVRVSATNGGSWRWGSVRMALQPDGDR